MSWGVKTTCFKAPGVSLGGSGVSIGGVRSLRAPGYISLVITGGPDLPSHPPLGGPTPRPNAARGDDPWFAPNSEVREALAEAVEAAHGSFKILVAWNFSQPKNPRVILGKLLANKLELVGGEMVGLRCCFNWGYYITRWGQLKYFLKNFTPKIGENDPI